MYEHLKIGLTCLITFILLSMIVLNIFLHVGRRIEEDFKDLIMAGLKTALTTSVFGITFIFTVIKWFSDMQTSLDLYIYFLTCVTSIIETKYNYKIYKNKEKKYFSKILKKEIFICPKCNQKMRLVDSNNEGTIAVQSLRNEIKVYACRKCGYIEIYKNS